MASDCVARPELVRGTHGTEKHLFTIEENVTFERTPKERDGPSYQVGGPCDRSSSSFEEVSIV